MELGQKNWLKIHPGGHPSTQHRGKAVVMLAHFQQEHLGSWLHHLVAEKELDKVVSGTPAAGGSQGCTGGQFGIFMGSYPAGLS